MYQNLPDRGCNTQTSTSPLTRVYRLHRQYINTQDSPIPNSKPGQTSGVEEATEAHSEVEDSATGPAWEEPSPGETSDTVPRLHVNTVAHGPTNQEKNARPHIKSVTTVENLDIFQKCAGTTRTIKIMKGLQ